MSLVKESIFKEDHFGAKYQLQYDVKAGLVPRWFSVATGQAHDCVPNDPYIPDEDRARIASSFQKHGNTFDFAA